MLREDDDNNLYDKGKEEEEEEDACYLCDILFLFGMAQWLIEFNKLHFISLPEDQYTSWIQRTKIA